MSTQWLVALRGTLQALFTINKATLDASSLSANRTFTLPDSSGQIALTSDISGGGLSEAQVRARISLGI